MSLKSFWVCLVVGVFLIFYTTASGRLQIQMPHTVSQNVLPAGSARQTTTGTTLRHIQNYPLHFVGDSRTVGLANAVPADTPVRAYTSFTMKIGQGYDWLTRQTDLTTLAPSILILNLGVNDLGNCARYQALYETYSNTCWKDCPIYLVSVNPCGAACSNVSNAEIEAFNASMQAWVQRYNASLYTENAPADARTLPIYYIDTYQYLMENGFSTSDGLHYDAATYRNLYEYILEQIQEPIGDGSGFDCVVS